MYSQDGLPPHVSGCHRVVLGLVIMKTLFAAGSCVEKKQLWCQCGLVKTLRTIKVLTSFHCVFCVPSYNTPRGAWKWLQFWLLVWTIQKRMALELKFREKLNPITESASIFKIC